jgi:hypothetical protein
MRRRDSIDRMLARGALSAPERERIFAKAYRGATFRPGRYLLTAVPVAAAAFGLIVALRPIAPDASTFSAKGTGSTPRVDVECYPGTLAACPIGATLIFRPTGASGRAVFLHAYAEPAQEGGERVWYWPAREGAPIRVEGASSEPLSQAVRIGSEHAPGAYRVHLVWADAPLTREQLLRDTGSVLGTDTVSLTVVAP